MGKRDAQVAMQRVLQENEILLPQRLVEPERGNGAPDIFLICLRIDQDVDRVADGEDAQKTSSDMMKSTTTLCISRRMIKTSMSDHYPFAHRCRPRPCLARPAWCTLPR